VHLNPKTYQTNITGDSQEGYLGTDPCTYQVGINAFEFFDIGTQYDPKGN
jgi:hypothetical protein